MKIPGEVRMYEKRADIRNKLGHQSPYTAIIEKKINNISHNHKMFEFTIFDLSKSGASFYFSPKDQIYFSKGDHFDIYKLGDINFKFPIGGKIIYIKKIEFFTQGHRQSKMKMGIELNREISIDILTSFK